jgi:YebC/PmpR family DNA-binding regulatory protein
MSGHNRWSKIKNKKFASDARKSKGWSKQLKAVTLAASTGLPDPAVNPSLRSAMEKAKSDGIPNETIARAVKKGSGELGEVALEQLLYEAYGPGGTAVVIDILTDSRNRTAAEIRYLLEEKNAKLALAGAVTYLFKRRGTLVFTAEGIVEDRLMEAALEAGAEDLLADGDSFTVLTEPSAMMTVRDALEKLGFVPASCDVVMLPDTTVKLEGREAESLVKLINALEEHDDVQHVYFNADVADEVYERLAE